MFFFVRSAICIGLVVAALPDPSDRWKGMRDEAPAMRDAATRMAVEKVMGWCGGEPHDCVGLASRLAQSPEPATTDHSGVAVLSKAAYPAAVPGRQKHVRSPCPARMEPESRCTALD